MIQLTAAALLLFFQGTAKAQESTLSDGAVWIIAMNTPAAIELEARHGCPAVEVMTWGEHTKSVQLRNACPASGSGLVDNYYVDLRTGQIWSGIDDKKYIDTERLRRLRDLLLKCSK